MTKSVKLKRNLYVKLLKAGKFLQQNKQSKCDVTRKLYYDVPSANQRERIPSTA